mgnify:FL=1
MAVQIQVRNDTAANWTSANPVLAVGEFGYETDTGQVKVGDGSTAWSSLSYFGVSSTYVDNSISSLVDAAPGALDTLNELAAALGDDANFATTVTNSIATKAPLAQFVNAQSANYTLQASDNGGIIKASGTITITVPDAVFAEGERVDIVNEGTGVITIAAGAGVTILSKDSAVTIDAQYAAATLLFETASQAFLIGSIA